MAAAVRAMEENATEENSMVAPPWVLTNVLSMRVVGVAQRDGVWSVLVKGPAATSRSLDGAIVSAVDSARPLAPLTRLASTADARS